MDSNGIMYRPDHLMLGKASIDGIDAGFIRRVPEQGMVFFLSVCMQATSVSPSSCKKYRTRRQRVSADFAVATKRKPPA